MIHVDNLSNSQLLVYSFQETYFISPKMTSSFEFKMYRSFSDLFLLFLVCYSNMILICSRKVFCL